MAAVDAAAVASQQAQTVKEHCALIILRHLGNHLLSLQSHVLIMVWWKMATEAALAQDFASAVASSRQTILHSGLDSRNLSYGRVFATRSNSQTRCP